MNSEQRRRVRDLFEAVVDRDPEAAVEWVTREAADDPGVRDEVLSLLDHHSRAGEFLSNPIADSAAGLLTDDEPIAAGTRIGGYTIVRELGRGGMGRVYLASDERLGRTVALKALAPHLTSDPSQRERLRREARAAAGLTHPGICTVYALEEIDGDLFIASEFVDGHTLAEEIRGGQRPATDEIVRTARELAAALASAHARGIVHRDLKPENVMRARDGRLKILDFGLARIVDTARVVTESDERHASTTRPLMHTLPGVLLGTPAYMAPEQINGQAADVRTDVFAFGVLLYEFASGAHPFAGGTELATVARVLEGDARPLVAFCPRVPPGVSDVIARCLRKYQADRFGSAAELAAALDAVSAAGPSPSPHATWWRAHQSIVALLYVVGAAMAWQIKDWNETPVTIAFFIALGAAATIGCVLRGHLIFTEIWNRSRLGGERRRTSRAMMLLDVIAGVLLLIDGVILAGTRALPAVLTIALALGIVLASLVLEPATTVAAFGDDS